MRSRKLLTSVICLVSVFVLIGTAQALRWKGFSELCFECQTKGRVGERVEVTITSAVINVQCYNTNTGNLSQPGVGNLGYITLTAETAPAADPGKLKGVIAFGECLDLTRWDCHDYHETPADHLCWPYDNNNKEELCDSGWIAEFWATWVWYVDIDDNGEYDENIDQLVNDGTDWCEWTGEIVDGYPTHAEFECTSETLKKLDCKWKLEE